MYSNIAGAAERSTDDARNSRTSRRLNRTRSESVLMDMSGSTWREQAGTSAREPSSSTTHTRQTLTGVRLSRKQSVGVSIPSFLAASRMVEPSATETGFPSILTSMVRRSSGGGASGIGPRGTGKVGCGASGTGVISVESLLMKKYSIVSARIPGRWRRSGPGRRWKRHAWLGPSRATERFPVLPSQVAQLLPDAVALLAAALRRRGRERTGRRFHGERSWRCAAGSGEDQPRHQRA